MGYAFTDYALLRSPDEDAGDDVPADLAYLAQQLDTVVTLRAVSLSDRDSKFYDAPSGVLCIVKNPDDAITDPGKLVGVYIKTSNPGTALWDTVWEPSSGVTFSPLQMADQYTTRGTPTYDPQVYVEPGGVFAQLSGAIQRIDGANITNGSTIAFLPGNALPLRDSCDFPAATTYFNTSQGNFKVTLNSDSSVVYYGPNVVWVGLESVRYFRRTS